MYEMCSPYQWINGIHGDQSTFLPVTVWRFLLESIIYMLATHATCYTKQEMAKQYSPEGHRVTLLKFSVVQINDKARNKHAAVVS